MPETNTKRPAPALSFHSRGTAAQALGITVATFDKLAARHQVAARVRMCGVDYYSQAQVDRMCHWLSTDPIK